MKIAIFGATSQIAKDLIESFAKQTNHDLTLFSRNSYLVSRWLARVGILQTYRVLEYSDFNVEDHYDAIINFVGAGNPSQIRDMGNRVFNVTIKYDEMIIDYLQQHRETKYIFLSSGAVYGGDFAQPASLESLASIPINHLSQSNSYAIAKLYAEAKHRALSDLSIIDIRVFNYFSHSQNLDARFFITDIIRSIKNKDVFLTMSDNIVRDFLVPEDFFGLISVLLKHDTLNLSIDCFTKSPIDKFTLLSEFESRYGLVYEISSSDNRLDATGVKINYFSNNKLAEDLGYKPTNTSLSGLIKEFDFIDLCTK